VQAVEGGPPLGMERIQAMLRINAENAAAAVVMQRELQRQMPLAAVPVPRLWSAKAARAASPPR
jgi:hypothetical protein